MTKGLSATEGALKAGAAAMRSCREALTDELKALKGKLAGLPSTWTGDGAKEFADCVEDWFAGTGKTINVLDKFESDLTESDRSYGMTDEESKASFDKFANLLGGSSQNEAY